MIAYVDTSALLRLVLREPGGLEELRSCEALVSSELIAVESLRAIDRLRLQGVLSTEEAASRRETAAEWHEAVDLVLLQRPILARAAEPFPTPFGTLDALHLSTALAWQDRTRRKLAMATHDRDLALAARSFGFDVRGVRDPHNPPNRSMPLRDLPRCGGQRLPGPRVPSDCRWD